MEKQNEVKCKTCGDTRTRCGGAGQCDYDGSECFSDGRNCGEYGPEIPCPDCTDSKPTDEELSLGEQFEKETGIDSKYDPDGDRITGFYSKAYWVKYSEWLEKISISQSAKLKEQAYKIEWLKECNKINGDLWKEYHAKNCNLSSLLSEAVEGFKKVFTAVSDCEIEEYIDDLLKKLEQFTKDS